MSVNVGLPDRNIHRLDGMAKWVVDRVESNHPSAAVRHSTIESRLDIERCPNTPRGQMSRSTRPQGVAESKYRLSLHVTASA